jgi:hypothetical protein
MGSKLSAIPPAARRRMTAVVAVFSALFVAVGVVAATDARTTAVTAFGLVALVVAVLLAGLAWGLLLTIRADRAEGELDAVVEQEVEASGRSREIVFGCGHEHDPNELHVTDSDQPSG